MLLEQSNGEYINFLMDDDIFYNNKIEKMMFYFQKRLRSKSRTYYILSYLD